MGRDGGHVARVRDGLIVDLQACGDWREPFELVPAARPADLVRRGYDALNAADVAALRELVSADCEFRPLVGELEGTTYTGPDGLLAYRQYMHEAWVEVHWLADRIDVREDGDVLAEVVMRARGRDGIELERRAAVVFWADAGVFIRIQAYGSEAEALRAAGRPPAGDSQLTP